jgi:hypothetical protein
MKEILGDLWHFHKPENLIVITTNGSVRRDGRCVMGRGVAKQAADLIPTLALDLGIALKGRDGNSVYHFPQYHLATFPVKHQWWEEASPWMIAKSTKQLVQLVNALGIGSVYMPRPGCGSGGLYWHGDVKPILEPLLDDRFTIVSRM